MQTLLLNSCPVQSVAAKIAAPIRLHCLSFQVVYHPFISLEEPPIGTAKVQIKTITVENAALLLD
jgi:hypothetical protein